MSKTKPLFIVFEGIEGCGKSFQSKKLLKNLKKRKINALLTREPGGTKSAELIRKLILQDYFNKDKKEKFDKYTDTLLYLASRNEHVKNKIIPALKKRKVDPFSSDSASANTRQQSTRWFSWVGRFFTDKAAQGSRNSPTPSIVRSKARLSPGVKRR